MTILKKQAQAISQRSLHKDARQKINYYTKKTQDQDKKLQRLMIKCDMPVNAPFPTTDVREEGFDINSPLGEYVVDFFMKNMDEFEDISSLDPHELTSVIDESTLLVTLPLPCTDVLGDAIVDIDLLLGEHLDTLSTGDREIDFNPSRDIEELERLLADDPVPVPRFL
ncbi:hypothetical protein Tco_0098977 [Tanacetum coccineum]